MEYKYGNLKNLAELKSAVNQSGITDSIPPENPKSLYFGTQASLMRQKFFPSLTPMNSPDKNENKEKKEESLTGEIIETGIQHSAIHALGEGMFNTSIIAFALEFVLKANEAYHEMKLNKELAMEAEGDIKLGRSTQPSFTDLKSRIKVLKSELDDDEQNKRKRKSSNSIRYGRNAKYSPY